MNRHQRDKNRNNANILRGVARQKASDAHTCENCGEKGFHFVATAMTLEDMFKTIAGQPEPGFWTCAILYDSNGVRKEVKDACDNVLGIAPFGALS